MKKKIELLSCMIIVWTTCVVAISELPLVVIVPSYNNKRWHFDNLNSIIEQKYSNFRVIYINDCSTDNTSSLVSEYLEAFDINNRVTLINNSKRRGSLANIYDAVHSCNDNEIILLLDGDDHFANNNVLSYINRVYSTEDVWLTYGQYKEWPSDAIGFNKPFSQDVIEKNKFRKTNDYLPMSHLKTFYAWLFKRIKKEDLMINGDFFPATGDKAIMAPMIEMAGHRHKCIEDILYIYNNNNPINVHSVNKEIQMKMMYHILALPPYKCLTHRRRRMR